MNRQKIAKELVRLARELGGGAGDVTPVKRWLRTRNIPKTLSERRQAVREISDTRPLDLTGWMSDNDIEKILSRIPDNVFVKEYKKAR